MKIATLLISISFFLGACASGGSSTNKDQKSYSCKFPSDQFLGDCD